MVSEAVESRGFASPRTQLSLPIAYDEKDTPRIVVRGPNGSGGDAEGFFRDKASSMTNEVEVENLTPGVSNNPSNGQDRKHHRRASVEPDELDSPEDLGVTFAMRVASKFQARHRTMHLMGLKKAFTSTFTKVMPPDDEDRTWGTKRASYSAGRTNSDLIGREKTGFMHLCKSGLAGLLTLRRKEKVLMCSAAVSGFYVTAGLAVEPFCVPAEAGNVFERLSSPRHRSAAVFALLHLAMAVAYAAAVLGGWLVQAISQREGQPKDGSVVGDLSIPHDEAGDASRWWSPVIFLELLGFVGTAAEVMHTLEAESVVPTATQWIMTLQALKWWRLLQPSAAGGAEQGGLLWGFARVLFSLSVFAHIMQTVLMVIGVQEAAWGERSWIQGLQGGIDHQDGCAVLYIEGWYFAVLSLTSVGYGDLLVTPLERGVNSFFLLLSQLYTAKVCADLTWITSTHNHWEAQHQAQRAQAWVALQHMQVPRILAERVMAFQTYLATVHREDLMQPAFEGLSKNLMMELRLCAYRKLVISAPFLKEQPKNVMIFIVGALTDSVFLPGDIIVRSGDPGRELFFMRRGKAQVYVGANPPIWGISEPVKAYEVGNYFGELGMLTGHPRKAWIMAELYSVVSVLPYSAVETLMNTYPGAFTSLVQAMVLQYELKSSMTWDQVTDKLEAKYGFGSSNEAFSWFLSVGKSKEEHDDELGAKAFEEALMKIKVPSLDRKILWAEIDQDNSGYVTLDEFSQRIVIDGDVPFRSRDHTWTAASCSSPISRTVTGTHQDMLGYRSLGPTHWLGQNAHCLSRVGSGEVAVRSNPDIHEVLQEVREMRKEMHESRDQARTITMELNALKNTIGSDLPAGMGLAVTPPASKAIAIKTTGKGSTDELFLPPAGERRPRRAASAAESLSSMAQTAPLPGAVYPTGGVEAGSEVASRRGSVESRGTTRRAASASNLNACSLPGAVYTSREAEAAPDEHLARATPLM